MYDEYQIRGKAKKDSNLDPGHWLGFLMLIIMLLFIANQCHGQSKAVSIDTIACHNECIDKFVYTTTEKGTVKYFAVYNCKKQQISDLIPVSKTVMIYINTCKENGIVPSLAIRLKNGIITNIIRYKPKYVRK